jgi:hypothetical protein
MENPLLPRDASRQGKKDEYRDKLHLFLAVLPPLPRHLVVSARLGGEIVTLRRSVTKIKSDVKGQRKRHNKYLLINQSSTLSIQVHRQNWYGRVHSLRSACF